MHSTDQLLSRIDSLLTTTKRHAASDLHLRVMDLLDNPTQCAILLDWDIETFEVTAQDRVELDWLDGSCTRIFTSSYQQDRFNTHSPCVVCDSQPSVPEYSNLFCSTYCAFRYNDTDSRADWLFSYCFDDFYKLHDDLPKPLYTSNVCVAPMYLLKT